MQVRRLAVWSSVTALSLGVAACGGDEEESGGEQASGGEGAKTATIYSSLPLQGASRPQSEDVIKGIKLAIKQAGNKAGDCTIKYVSLDDATAAAGKWEAGQTSANARKVAQDDSAIAYIGEFNSGASAISMPILNEAGILQVSPSNTAYGLTKSGPGAEPGEPDKYYPTGNRHYGRVVPADHIQAAALAQYMKDEGVTQVYVLDDNEVYGQGLAQNTVTALEELGGIEIVGQDSWEGKASNYRALAAKIKETGADGILTAGIIDNNAPQLYKDLNAAMPEAKIFGPDGVATVSMVEEIPAKVQEQTFLTVAAVSPEELPEAGKKFYEDYAAEYKEPQDEIDPYAIFGYEAAGAVLQAIEEGGCEDKQAVIDAFMNIENRESALGTYSIDENGDTTLTNYGGYRAKGGKLVFDHAIQAEAEAAS